MNFALNLFYYAMSKNLIEDIICVENVKDGLVLHEQFGQFSTTWHKHNYGQLLYAENGLLFLHTLNNRFLVPTKFCAWIPANEIHQLVSYSSNLLIRTIYLDESDHQELFYKKTGIYQTTPLLEELISYSKRWRLAGASDESEICFYRNLKNLLPDICQEEILLILPAPKTAKLTAIISYMTAHLLVKHSTNSIAVHFGVSERTLSRLFQKELGMPMFQFLKILKIIKALEWFDEGVANVSEVVYRLGYESVSTFSNTFTEIMGYRPQAYLQKKKKLFS